MNEFEKHVPKRNDFLDAGMGFVVSFGFLTIMFIIATVIWYFGQ